MRLIKIDQSRVWLVFFLLGFFSHIAVGQSYTGTYYVNGNFVLGDGQVIQNGSNYYSEFYVDDTNEVLTVDGGVLNVRNLYTRNGSSSPYNFGPSLVQNGGEIKTDYNLYVGADSRSGDFTINDGSLYVGLNPSASYGRIYLSNTFTQNGGEVDATSINFDFYQNNAPTYIMNDGTLSLRAGAPINNQSYSQFIQNGGDVSLSGGTKTLYNVTLNGGTMGGSGVTTMQLAGNSEVNGGTLIADDVRFSSAISGTAINIIGGASYTQYLQGQDLTVAGDLYLGSTSSTDYSETLNIGNLVTSNGSAYFDSGTVVSSGDSITNNSIWQFNDGEIQGGNAAITNNGFINGGFRVTTDQSFNNNGGINVEAQTLYLNVATGSNNYGSIESNTGGQIQINVAELKNYGQISLGGAIVAGSGTFENSYGGLLTGSGVVLSDMENYGIITPNSGALYFANAFANYGNIAVDGVTSSITGASITNFGTINGSGNIANDIENSGTISSASGSLTLGGNITNAASGLLNAAAGGQVLALQGISTNSGVINLTGGTIDNNNNALSNEGQISGYGTLRTGGLSNSGSIELTGGITTVNGAITNAGQVHVAYDAAIFTGDFINNGIFKTTDTNVSFTGSYTENGIYISDPSDNYFQDLLIGENGSLVGGVGDNWHVSGDLINASTQASSWNTNDASLFMSGAGNQLLELSAEDLGASLLGYDDNFAWGELHVGSGIDLTLADGNAEEGGALYVGLFNYAGPVDFSAFVMAAIFSDYNIYYDADLAGNSYLMGNTFALNGSGSLIGISSVPIPAAAWLFGSALAGLLVARRKRS